MIFFARTKPSKLNKKFPNFNGLTYRQKTTAKNKDSFVNELSDFYSHPERCCCRPALPLCHPELVSGSAVLCC